MSYAFYRHACRLPFVTITLSLAAVMSVGCGRARESERAPFAPVSSPTVTPSKVVEEEANEAAPASQMPPSEMATPDVAAVPAPDRQKKSESESKASSESLGKAKRAAPSPAAREARPSAEKASESDLAIPKQPAFAEPPELVTLLKEFDAQLELFAASDDCATVCRAYDSLRRCADRICELSPSADPRERCRVARSRLEQATRELTSRCPSCR